MQKKSYVGNSHMNFPNKMQSGPFIVPIIVLSIFRACSLTLVNLGLPNYIIFDLKESSVIAGFTMTIYRIPPAILSYFFAKLSDKVGRKRILVISIIGINLSYFIYLTKFSTLEAIFSRFFEGVFTSMFWPVLEALISDYKLLDSKNNKLIGNYNMSWNIGGFVGLIIGAIAVFIIGNNIIIFYIACMFGILLIPTIFFLKIYSGKTNYSKSQLNDKNLPAITPGIINPGTTYIDNISTKARGLEKKEIDHELILSSLPLLIPTLILLLYSFTLGSISVMVSTKFDLLGIAAYTTYLLSFFLRIFSVIFARFAAKPKRNLPRYIIIVGILYSIPSFFCAIFIHYPFYIILFILLGFTSISIYSVAFKIVLEKNRVQKTGKYTGFAEGILGIGYGGGPLLMGLIACYSVNLSFILLGFYGIIITIIIYFFVKKAVKL